MENTEKRIYTPPTLTVVRFKAERGFALSSAILDELDHLFEFSSDDPNVTQYNEDDSWAGYSWS